MFYPELGKESRLNFNLIRLNVLRYAYVFFPCWLLKCRYHPDHWPGVWIRNDFFKQCCGSGMFIPDPDFCPSRISVPGSKNCNKREGWKKISSTFFCNHKNHNWNLSYCRTREEKNLGQFTKNYGTLHPKIVINLKYEFGIGDLGSRKTLFRIPDPGVKKAPDPDLQQ